MIKIVSARVLHDNIIAIGFSDGAGGEFDVAPLIAKQSSLTLALKDPAFFKAFFLELGALCWPNGLELSPGGIYRDLEAQGKLIKQYRAA